MHLMIDALPNGDRDLDLREYIANYSVLPPTDVSAVQFLVSSDDGTDADMMSS